MIQLGIEVLLTSRRALINGKRIGLVTNYAMIDRNYNSVIDLMTESEEWQVVKLFGPEHGVKNSAKEGEHVLSEIDRHTGIPVYSLYGETKKPSPEMLSDLDVLVIDLQDIGCRYYTNMNTIFYCMEACTDLGLPCVVLDRPNPINGISREGNILRPEFHSFVGMHAIPNRHGLTMGELAIYFKEQIKNTCDLTVVETQGWKRKMLLTDTELPFIPTSPNTTSLDMCLLYPGTCLFEGTNLSLGRGTAHPFEIVGAPFINGHRLSNWVNEQKIPGVMARPLYFTPTYSTYTGELCSGIQLHVTDSHKIQSVRTGLILLQGIAELFTSDFKFLKASGKSRPFFDLLAGTDKLRSLIFEGRALRYLIDDEAAIEHFSCIAKEFELY